MVDQLFGSKTRVKLLQLFYSNPNRSFYVREITRKIDEQINSVRRELSNLLSIGIITSDNTNNRLYYEVNQGYEFYAPLSTIFGKGQIVSTDVDEAQPAVSKQNELQAFKALGRVDLALYTGQFTRDESSGIDLLIVGDVNQTKVDHFIEDLEKKEGKEIRFTVMSAEEFTYRMQINDKFLYTVLESKHQVLVDKNKVLSKKNQEEK